MLKLFQEYSVQGIIIFIILLCFAIREGVQFIDWARARIKQEYDKGAKVQDNTDEFRKAIKETQEQIKDTQNQIQTMQGQIKLLLDSDRDNIKSDIVDKHHFFCYEQKWIDDYSLDCLGRRFSHYVDEGGNSYIEELMEEIKQLPKQPPRE